MFKIMLVTDRKRSRQPLTEAVRQAVGAGVDAVQLRERDLPAGELFRLAEELRKITRAAGARLIVNHRVDVALAVEADGVHLGWRSMRPEDARRLAGARMMIGLSCHSEEQLRAAEESGADYAIVGPIFPTPSKEGLVEALGADLLRRLAATAKLPVIAIGGINAANAAQMLSCGAAGVAAITALLDDPRPLIEAVR